MDGVEGSKLRIVTLLLTVLLMMGAAAQAATSSEIAGVASVIDGDTIEIHGVRIRLHGIDAPESRQECQHRDGSAWRCGQKASFALADRIGRGLVRCQRRDRDRYGRIVAVCFKGGEDLNRWLVTSGWAVAFQKYSFDYVTDEDAARRTRINIWSGNFDMPWEWRAERRNRR